MKERVCTAILKLTIVDLDPIRSVYGPVAVGLALHRRHALLAVRAEPDKPASENIPVLCQQI